MQRYQLLTMAACKRTFVGSIAAFALSAGLGSPTLARSPESYTLQSLVDAASSGAVVSVPAGIYRETVRIDKSLTLVGQPGTEIRGSDVWSDWSMGGRGWHSSQTVPWFPTHGMCVSADNRCLAAEQVFVDGARLSEDFSGAPVDGQFALDATRHVVLASSPTGHTVEVTTRTAWIDAQADDVTIQGFTMKHAANDAQVGALTAGGRANWTMEDNVLSDAHGVVVALSTGNNLRLLRNDIFRGGQMGVQGGNGSGDLIQSNRIHDNNIDGFLPGWEAGGLKAAQVSNSTWDSNEVYDNIGGGLWCDMDCRDITISNNRVYRNVQGAGIMFEISDSAKIFGNSAWSNGSGLGWGWGAGILVAGSGNVEIYNNVLAWNQAGISLISQNRSDLPSVGAVNNYVHDNAIVMGTAPESLSLSWLQDWNGPLFAPSSNNRGASNTFWYPGPETGSIRFGWQGPISHLSDSISTPLGDGSYLTDAQEQQVLASRGMQLAPD
jgi:hypothetical protein